MSLNYNIIDTFKLLINSFKHTFFIFSILAVLIYIFIIFFNRNRKISKTIVLFINIILIIIILYYYLISILSFKFNNPLNNIYFYFLNSIIYLIITIIIKCKRNYNIFEYVIYCISLVFIIFSCFITKYLSNVNILVIGNIYPMIKLGNIIYIIYYIYLIIKLIRAFLTKKN